MSSLQRATIISKTWNPCYHTGGEAIIMLVRFRCDVGVRLPFDVYPALLE